MQVHFLYWLLTLTQRILVRKMIQDNTQIVLTINVKSLSLGQFPFQHTVVNDQVGGHCFGDILHVEIKLFVEDVTQLSAVVDNLFFLVTCLLKYENRIKIFTNCRGPT